MKKLSSSPKEPLNFFIYLRLRMQALMPWVIGACLMSLSVEFLFQLSSTQAKILHFLDLFFLIFFVTDLILVWKTSRTSKEFFKQNWLNILAIIPVIRALRFIRFSGLARFGRLTKLARFQKGKSFLRNISRGEKTIKRIRKTGKRFLVKD